MILFPSSSYTWITYSLFYKLVVYITEVELRPCEFSQCPSPNKLTLSSIPITP